MSSYNEALRLWGANRLADRYYMSIELSDIDVSTVTVEMEFDRGYACCNGTDPDCYCSLAMEPSAEVVIRGKNINGSRTYIEKIDVEDFSFTKVLEEILEAGEALRPE